AIVAFGLLCFGIFQLIRAIEDPEHAGADAKGSARRVGWAWNALVHFGLVAIAIGMMVGLRHASAGSGDDERQVRDWTATAMSYPFGRWIVGAIGVGILISGV